MLSFFLICLALGCVVGFLAGLFGIGGGLIIVPALVYLLPMVGVPNELLMSTALGTSFATIVITGFSSAQRHHKLGNIVWNAVKILAPVIMITTFISGLFVGKLDKAIASKLFACLVVYLAVKMLLSIKPKAVQKTLTTASSVIGGILIGIASSIAGIGGGGFIVPFLNARGIEMKQAIGSSAFCGMLLGLSGMLSFIVGGWGQIGMPNYSLGYVYLPAVIAITATSFFTSKLGASTTDKLPVKTLKRYFAVLLICIAINMLIK
ncbi:sulfite exporter TauE/SafE family protein [Avibacterium paragallinarum]|uniref:Probable membrane transporter protein n=1 Tax=Avibacterium paragallinarum TaxID=728 RepID=A0AAE5WHV1_AVIPA|nr:sulfite exporter TauE/SafE family protein [Avibacterium paragallinarum]MEE3609423.1 sulfite exporter TauE/SafE family protein [Avibacterium paragallinarum]MEE3620969.1 sulfite exporter TauE/SafE family protein [Avibacterium paragallinarum]MEE3668738.1 sulfite exporter TauE/SafE family protein [Avibacterium paragallinarum]MEE3681439.1 sulfite exporter TauE/SafE family protein [Avibacterium paragallinarum]MEE4386804.1 sulfite exporter TauE/SafE family protein [Avibacterium paragallinarum]